MGRLIMGAAFAAVVLSVGALDNTIHNSFWDTRAYVNPSPSVSYSESSVTATFDLSGRSWRMSDPFPRPFNRKPCTGFCITIR